MGHETHTATVFAPELHLTVTIERSSSGHDEVHIHPGGQGFWVARMLKHLDERPLLCGPLGGESGRVFRGLLGQFGMDASTIEIAHRSPVVINDRRSGDREIIADSPAVTLERHEIDDLYGRLLDRAMMSALCVVTGRTGEPFPIDFFRRLGHDLASGGVEVIADLHGPELWTFLDGGPARVLKVSDQDLFDDGILDEDADDQTPLIEIVKRLGQAGARNVVLSRQHRPVLANFDGDWFEARTPKLDPADHRGAGDSMTAGLTAAVRQGLGPEDTIRLACAAGAANVTRHGLGSADNGLVPGLIEKIKVRRLESVWA